jgi:hypothetical protein
MIEQDKQKLAEEFEVLSMWCTDERHKIRGRGGFDNQSEREIGIGIVEAEIDRRSKVLRAALRAAPKASGAEPVGRQPDLMDLERYSNSDISKRMWESYNSCGDRWFMYAAKRLATPPVADAGVAVLHAEASKDYRRLWLSFLHGYLRDMAAAQEMVACAEKSGLLPTAVDIATPDASADAVREAFVEGSNGGRSRTA